MPPMSSSSSPVAVTMTSASTSSPPLEQRRRRAVNRSMRSVTTDARPSLIAANRSPSGTTQSRWSHGPYDGLKCVSTS